MAEVQVFVDDAVRGDLPPVCTKTGLPTHDQLRMSADVGGNGGLGLAWLLVFLGPLGWLVLILFALTRRPAEKLVVQVPLADEPYEQFRQWRRFRTGTAIATIAVSAAVLLWMRTGHGGAGADGVALLLVVMTGLFSVLFADNRTKEHSVGVSLDGSRRWVTLSRVDEHFVAACLEQERQREHDRR